MGVLWFLLSFGGRTESSWLQGSVGKVCVAVMDIAQVNYNTGDRIGS